MDVLMSAREKQWKIFFACRLWENIFKLFALSEDYLCLRHSLRACIANLQRKLLVTFLLKPLVMHSASSSNNSININTINKNTSSNFNTTNASLYPESHLNIRLLLSHWLSMCLQNKPLRHTSQLVLLRPSLPPLAL